MLQYRDVFWLGLYDCGVNQLKGMMSNQQPKPKSGTIQRDTLPTVSAAAVPFVFELCHSSINAAASLPNNTDERELSPISKASSSIHSAVRWDFSIQSCNMFNLRCALIASTGKLTESKALTCIVFLTVVGTFRMKFIFFIH